MPRPLSEGMAEGSAGDAHLKASARQTKGIPQALASGTASLVFLWLMAMFLLQRGTWNAPLPQHFAGAALLGGASAFFAVLAWRYTTQERISSRHLLVWLGMTAVLAAIGAFALAVYIPITACTRAEDPWHARKLEAAKRELEACLRFPALTDEARAEALSMRARIRSLEGDAKGALADHEAALRLMSSQSPADHAWGGFYLRKAGRYQESLAELAAAERSVGGVNRFARYQRSWTLAESGDPKTAVKEMTALLSKDNAFIPALVVRGLAYEALKQEPRAKQDFAKALALTKLNSSLEEDAEAAGVLQQRAERYKLSVTSLNNTNGRRSAPVKPSDK